MLNELDSATQQGRNLDAREIAKRITEEKLRGEEISLGSDHLTTAETLSLLSAFYNADGQYDKAEQFQLRSLAIREKLLEPNHQMLEKV